MSLSAALFVLGIGQGIIFFVLWRFVKQAVVGKPSWLLRTIVGVSGLIAAALLVAAVWVM